MCKILDLGNISIYTKAHNKLHKIIYLNVDLESGPIIQYEVTSQDKLPEA